jgi:hypothetical protein
MPSLLTSRFFLNLFLFFFLFAWVLSPAPLDLLNAKQVVEVSAGKFHSLARTKSGLVLSWGHGRSGRLGHGDEHVRIEPTVKARCNNGRAAMGVNVF